ncbi:uncharacterized protein LOC134663853 [Cydia fagiglandana]|uniref:uncharacterized protein LOC134663853 n=1 Tax=Cydia fagiglandana TaxID=1458189 RepID=UPI002FEDFB3D
MGWIDVAGVAGALSRRSARPSRHPAPSVREAAAAASPCGECPCCVHPLDSSNSTVSSSLEPSKLGLSRISSCKASWCVITGTFTLFPRDAPSSFTQRAGSRDMHALAAQRPRSAR